MNDNLSSILHDHFHLTYAYLDGNNNLFFNYPQMPRLLGLRETSSRHALFQAFPETAPYEREIDNIKSRLKKNFYLETPGNGMNSLPYRGIHFFPFRRHNYRALMVIELKEESVQDDLQIHDAVDAGNDLPGRGLWGAIGMEEPPSGNRTTETAWLLAREKHLAEMIQKTRRLFEQTVNSLAYALETRDPYTAGHQDRVSQLACAIAGELGMDSDGIEGIKIAGKLHDIGKIYVPSEFLTKPGNLMDEEMSVIRLHPQMGFEILRDIEFPWPIASAVLQHHERLDGSGYPYGLTESEIKYEAKILAVADVVEAMGTNRPYRKSPGLDIALREIENKKSIHYDPGIVDACLHLFTQKGYQLDF